VRDVSRPVQAVKPSRPKRPFWLHQLAEYLVGIVLVAQGLQSPTPALPAAAGALIVVNAALVAGPLSAFDLVRRSLHRVLDVVVIAAVVIAAVQPWVEVEASARATMVGVALVHGFVWAQSSFAEKQPRAGRAPIGVEDGRGAEVGRLAGRIVGDGVNLARRLRKR